jgi:hypothetical protein
VGWLNDLIRAESNDVGAEVTSTPNRQRIIELRAAYNQALTQVRGDASLSELGKTQTIARAWMNTRAEIQRLAQLDIDTAIARFDTLEAEVFGASTVTGADAVSFRDATDRATKLVSSDAAAQALGTATLSGDRVLAQAVVLRAWQMGWQDVVDQYALSHPAVTDQLAELGSLRRHLDSRVSHAGSIIGTSLIKPTELADMQLDQITKLAQADP